MSRNRPRRRPCVRCPRLSARRPLRFEYLLDDGAPAAAPPPPPARSEAASKRGDDVKTTGGAPQAEPSETNKGAAPEAADEKVSAAGELRSGDSTTDTDATSITEKAAGDGKVEGKKATTHTDAKSDGKPAAGGAKGEPAGSTASKCAPTSTATVASARISLPTGRTRLTLLQWDAAGQQRAFQDAGLRSTCVPRRQPGAPTVTKRLAKSA